jgi:deaminated glutathione amidase
MDILKIALAQMTSIDDVSVNTQTILSLLKKLAPSEVACIFFPENCLYMRLREGEKIQGLELSHEAFQILADWARHNKTGIHLGSVPIRENGFLYNGTVWIDVLGDVKVTYKKIHLFDIQLENQKPIRESDVFKHGEGPQILNVEGWNLGQSICFDLRFSDLYHYYAKKHVEAILIPSAFLVKTGQAHWSVLMRARAIESQCYVIASAQAGIHKSENGQRETYGHSVVIDPWGSVIAELQNSPEIQVVELQKSRIQAVRSQIPMKDHRRGPF